MDDETLEHRLDRLFEGWTDAEVGGVMRALRESKSVESDSWHDAWREYARRTFPENVVCKRCGSDNHTAVNHDKWMGLTTSL